MENLIALFDFVFGCYHMHLSRVFTIEGRTYRVCCGCGAQFGYSLESMVTGPRLTYPRLNCPDLSVEQA
jgi:hypothetical protein